MPAQTCPRRMNELGPWPREEGVDRWEPVGHGLAGQEHVGLSCSFCGSLEPGRFLELVRDGWLVGPTDKGYKCYLAKPRTTDEIAAEKQRWLNSSAEAQAIRSVGEDAGRTAEQIDVELEQFWTTDVAPRLASGRQVTKFYFQHLSHEQRDEFIELHNTGRMKLSMPGHFYVPPYFTRRAEAA